MSLASRSSQAGTSLLLVSTMVNGMIWTIVMLLFIAQDCVISLASDNREISSGMGPLESQSVSTHLSTFEPCLPGVVE